MGDVIEPAADLAERGFPMYRSYMQWLGKFEARYAKDKPFSSVFFANGRIPQPGEMLPQPALAKALRTLARNGARDFYEGEIAVRSRAT